MKYILKGDLFTNIQTIRDESKSKQMVRDYIIHGCNAQGVMGSGFAKVLKEKYPKAYLDYKNYHDTQKLQLADTVFSDQGKSIIVVNAITQEYYGRGNKVYCNYRAIENCFEDIVRCLNKQQTDAPFLKLRLHYPKIGAGLGGGDWETIDKIIDEVVDGQFDQYLHLG